MNVTRVTLSGTAGTSKTTLGKSVAALNGVDFVSVGGLMRQRAEFRGMRLEELLKEAETNPSHDREIDASVRQLSIDREGFVIEGRLAWRFAQNSFNVLLTCGVDECARRISGRDGLSIEKALTETLKRDAGDRKRYHERYGLEDYADPKHYHAVIDTTRLTPPEVVELFGSEYRHFRLIKSGASRRF